MVRLLSEGLMDDPHVLPALGHRHRHLPMQADQKVRCSVSSVPSVFLCKAITCFGDPPSHKLPLPFFFFVRWLCLPYLTDDPAA